jgi:sarcosine oxidase
MNSYDAIVIGLGGVGSATLWRLAKRGLRVLGIDRFSPPHTLGSSHGETRIIRQAYFEHPDYVPLLKRAYTLWDELERETATHLFHRVGLLQGGRGDGVVVPGVRRSAREHNLSIEDYSAKEARWRWPLIEFGDELEVVYEPSAGYLRLEAAVQACLAAAQQRDAEIRTDTQVTRWNVGPEGLQVHVGAEVFNGQRLIITAGPWAAELLTDLKNVALEVRRKSLFWFATNNLSAAQLPTYLFELPEGVFYGFPAIDGRMKVGDHSGGAVVADPLHVNRDIDPAEARAVERFKHKHLPVAEERRNHAVCLYTMSPDENFIIDHYPDDHRIAFAAGLSGHGYKFAPVLGEALADLALEGGSELPIEFLGLKRFT